MKKLKFPPPKADTGVDSFSEDSMTTNISYLTPIELLALGKIKAGSADRDSVTPGSYLVDTVLAINGSITVGEDYTQKISPKLPWRDLFFAALSRLGPADRTAFVNVVETGGFPKITGSVQVEMSDYEHRLLKRVETTCKGKVTAQLTAEGITNEALV